MGIRTRDLKILYETKDGRDRIRVAGCRHHGRQARLLLVNGAVQSAMYTEPAFRSRLIFPYMREMQWLHALRPGSRRTLLLGAGGFAWPRHVLSEDPLCSVDAVEISRTVIDVSREWFDLPEDPRLRVFCCDAADYLRRYTGAGYDFVINDAFRGLKHAGSLHSRENLRQIRSVMNRDGVYAVNYPASLKGLRSSGASREMRRLRSVFRYTLLLPCEEGRSPYERQNCLLLASDSEL